MFYTVCIVWLVCLLLSYGGVLAFFEREYVDRQNIYFYENRIIAIMISACGPPGLLLAYLCTRRFQHGFTYW